MTAYYNEIDPYAAEWLENLIKAGHIAPGIVDRRSIVDVAPADLSGFRQCHFFAGIGGWSRALRLAGWPDDRAVWTGSCPCQPFSAAGKRRGVEDERHLWPEFRRLIGECSSSVVFGEQIASKDGRLWLSGVRVDLERMGYAVGAADLCAAGVSAPHIRQRLWWVGHADRGRPSEGRSAAAAVGYGRSAFADGDAGGVADAVLAGRPERRPLSGGGQVAGSGQSGFWSDFDLVSCSDGKARRVEPGSFPLAHGVLGRVGRLRAYGNAIVPPLAAEFIAAYCEAVQ